ncbi:shikimate kinase [Carboxylicivirga linearis]|uniref:Shikimate kinase n=1 Tax=Carboxylicivirga linearis TaxID=1628157 RepID=A0ABS5JPA9_9BACT|nr:shikimate kinase [Carboxylicivirga linearis]MBS2096720.1 shikimate kinase [Carboxylicivirga linearis]
MDIKRVFLVGFMGSGKSTLGRRLKHEMGWNFLDLDDVFEDKFQTSIKQYFADYGEESFRQAEKECLEDVIHQENLIIATGGGTPCFFDNMDVMNENGLTIYLKLSIETLISRLNSGKNVRPLVANKSGDELYQFIKEKLEEREFFYNQSKVIADAEVLGVEAFVNIIKASGDLSV